MRARRGSPALSSAGAQPAALGGDPHTQPPQLKSAAGPATALRSDLQRLLRDQARSTRCRRWCTTVTGALGPAEARVGGVGAGHKRQNTLGIALFNPGSVGRSV